MAKDLIIVGAGGFGREAMWTIERINAAEPTWNLLGFADDDPGFAGGSVEGCPVLGAVETASRDYPGAAIFIAIGDNEVREKLYRRLRGHDFPAIIDPSALVAPTAELRHGVFVGPEAVVSVGVRLGKFSIVNARSGVGHDSELGDFTQLCPGVSVSGHVKIGDGAYLGTNSSTVPGISIGKGAKVAAGTPVFASLADGATLSPFGTLKR